MSRPDQFAMLNYLCSEGAFLSTKDDEDHGIECYMTKEEHIEVKLSGPPNSY